MSAPRGRAGDGSLGNAPSGGYSVQTEALANTAQTYQTAADDWAALAQTLQGWYLGALDLGIIGASANVIRDYNSAVQSIITNTTTGGNNLAAAAQELRTSAQAYENQEQQNTQHLRQVGQH